MRLNPKLGWGLAWTGLALVLAVPSADFLTGRFGGDRKAAAVLTSDIDPVKPAAAATPPAQTASVTTTRTSNGVIITPAGSPSPERTALAADPVDKLLSTGKQLPDYISGGTTRAAPQTQMAAIDPAPVATIAPPTPFPAWARPRLAPAPAAPAAPAPSATAPADPSIVIIDENTRTGSIATPARPVPPAPIVDDARNWDTESLRQYLERRGILEGAAEPSSATVTERSTGYDPNGFRLSDGPNSDRETRRQRLQRLFEESGDDPDSFTLF